MRAELRDWDLWGPLFICMSLAVMLSLKAHDEASLVFSVIFVIMWLGAAVVTVNGQLLGGRLSFFQSVCLLGYCVFPILLSAAACLTINSFVPPGIAVIARFAAVVFALFWALFGTFFLLLLAPRCGVFHVWFRRGGLLFFFSCVRRVFLFFGMPLCLPARYSLRLFAASSSFMTDAKFPEGRKVLALYPVFLFYLSLAWMVTIGFQRTYFMPCLPSALGCSLCVSSNRRHLVLCALALWRLRMHSHTTMPF